MPQDVVFGLPWPLRASPYVSLARAHSLVWLDEYGLLDAQGFTADEFVHWRLAELAGFFFPEATVEGLELASDLIGWYFAPFDDQFDGPLGHDPRKVAGICEELAEAMDFTFLPASRSWSPAARGLADIWRRSGEGMSPAWRAKASVSWRGYLAAQAAESVNRRHGRVLDAEECVRRRGYATSSHVVIDLIERVGGFEVPELAWYSPTLARLRGLAAELIGLSNDLCSVEKEEACGDTVNNLLLVLERERGCSRQEAIALLGQLAEQRVERFLQTEKEVADLDCMLDAAGRVSVRRFVEGLHDLVRGDSEWERTSGRYTQDGIAVAARRVAAMPASRWRPVEGR
ncbi:pentalenene synthase [Streptomyces sp. NPDC101150]|uniref:terpene synthase family protein n=1 Tax=Streptomyces sp. NPDC101150 TaxID=3366114 RepID=UPI0038234D79